jgi:hypothetical protein
MSPFRHCTPTNRRDLEEPGLSRRIQTLAPADDLASALLARVWAGLRGLKNLRARYPSGCPGVPVPRIGGCHLCAGHHDPPPPPPPPPPEKPPPEKPLEPLPPEEVEWVAIQVLVVVANWWMGEK